MAGKKIRDAEIPPEPDAPWDGSPAMAHAMALREQHMADPKGIAWRKKHSHDK